MFEGKTFGDGGSVHFDPRTGFADASEAFPPILEELKKADPELRQLKQIRTFRSAPGTAKYDLTYKPEDFNGFIILANEREFNSLDQLIKPYFKRDAEIQRGENTYIVTEEKKLTLVPKNLFFS